MKYIRTKDGRIVKHPHPNAEVFTFRYEILKQADTVEELCDEFVWVSIENEYHNRKANEYSLRTSRMQVNSPQMKTIYGAIWTDKGLIYVAKMNDKGELELL